MRILVTGAAGAIGAAVVEHLVHQGEFVRSFDVRPSGVGSEVVVDDLADAEAVRQAMRGMEAVVHLGAVPRDAPFPTLIRPNVLGVFHVLDSMRREGVARVLLASSIQVLRPSEERHTSELEQRGPSNHYALTKVFAEEMGQMYAEHFGLEVLVARIGFMVRDPVEADIMKSHGYFDRYVSRADVARFCHLAISADYSGFDVLYAVGPGGRERFDLEAARRKIGYEPQDAWPEGLPFEPPS